jgi:hypothetical protein
VADVSAFANASGGDIVIGIQTQDGVASAIAGVSLADVDKEKLRLGDLIRMGVEPRLTHFDIEWFPIAGTQQGVMIVRIPRSWAAPHRVTLFGHDRFYIRNAAGKHPMNVDELRRAFTLSEGLVERIRQFRLERVSDVLADRGPFPPKSEPVCFIHIVPLSAFVDPPDLNLVPNNTGDDLRPLRGMGYNWQYCLEGFAQYNQSGAYTLGFRSGIVEAYTPLSSSGQSPTLINLGAIETVTMTAWTNYVRFCQRHGIEPPLYLFLTLTTVRNVNLRVPQMHTENPVPYRQDILRLPEIVILDIDTPNAPLLKPLFDRLANAFGLAGSYNYRPDGRYEPPRW